MRPLKFVAIDTTWTPTLLMKSLTNTPGDIPKSRSSTPDSGKPVTGMQLSGVDVSAFLAE